MRCDHDPWSIGLGRWNDIEVRLHGSFLVGLLFFLLVAWRESIDSETALAGITGLLVVVWFLSVLAREAGSCAIRHQLGGSVDIVLLTPVGGIRQIHSSRAMPSELVPILAGPMVSIAILLIAYALVRSRAEVGLPALIQPESLRIMLGPGGLDPSWTLAACKMAVFANGWIVLCNLIPAFPFDAAWACAAIVGRVRREWDSRRSWLWMCIISRGMALVLFLMAVILHDRNPRSILPIWLVLIIIAVCVYFSTRAEEERLTTPEEEEEEFGYDFSQGYTSLEREFSRTPRRSSPFRRWLTRLRRRWQLRQARREAEEDRRVDSILQRLHTEGPESLSLSERALLRRVSVRYRNRLSK